ncbi:hypothetical protein OPV22_014293 [Ensete ventricosum]|uniref:Sucrose-phosphatase n=1 Tax=Ensete ventricosum TaxID=4639 RepID=A0AAV8R7P0_ENSVE|nr:hypothetical protein OPV22_014293 [Ensete ventricosum]
MDRLDGRAHLMIVSDLNNTMVDHQDAENISLLRFNALWESEYRYNSLLVFSTGTQPISYKKLRKRRPLPTPDITILSLGTEIFYGESMVPDDDWEHYLNRKWDRDVVIEETAKFPQLSLQPPEKQRPLNVGFYLNKDHAEEVMKSLPKLLANRGVDVKFVYGGGFWFDVIPSSAGKGEALVYLQKKFKSEGKLPINTLVCGDSGNDVEMFRVPDVYGVVVSNAHEELPQWYAQNCKDHPKIVHATERCADGIIQAIAHFKLGPDKSPRDAMDFSGLELGSSDPVHEVVMFYLLYERWRRAEVENSDSIILQNMKSITHPTGIIVHPSGVVRSLPESIDAFAPCYGDQQGKRFRVWVDRVCSSRMGSDAWLVKFHKWELSDEGRHCCLTSTLWNAKPEAPEEFALVRVHQTWLDGYAAKDQPAFIF